MAEEKLDFTSQFINQIKAKIAALQSVLTSVESASALGALAQPSEGINVSSAGSMRGEGLLPTDLPEGAFNGKSVPACIELYLSSSPMKKKTNKDIGAALREGGVETNANNFDATVNAALFKLKKDGTVLRFKDGWGLSSWYPAHIRGAADAGSGKQAKKKGKSTRRKNGPSKPPNAASGQSTALKGKASDLILELLRSKPDHERSVAEIAEHIGVGVQVASMVLGTLRKGGKVRMTAPDMYVIGRPQLVAAQA
jgi:hypothetical protein